MSKKTNEMNRVKDLILFDISIFKNVTPKISAKYPCFAKVENSVILIYLFSFVALITLFTFVGNIWLQFPVVVKTYNKNTLPFEFSLYI